MGQSHVYLINDPISPFVLIVSPDRDRNNLAYQESGIRQVPGGSCYRRHIQEKAAVPEFFGALVHHHAV